MATSNQAIAGQPEISAGSFCRVIWRWHFYAGLFVIPFLVMLSVTGIIYLFKPQLDRLMYSNLMYVTPASQRSKASDQLAAVRRAYPGAHVISYKSGESPDRSAESSIHSADGRLLTVYINPYSQEVLGAMDPENNFQAYVVKLHGELMIGRMGDWLVELAACWGLVLLATGLFLWFPRKGSRIWGVLLPRLDRKNRRVFWRDLHAVSGVYGALVIGFLILTGLPWAGFWGTNFARVWSQYPPQQSPDGFKSILTGSLNKTTGKAVPWAVEQLPMPVSQSASGHEHHSLTKADSAASSEASALDLDTVLTLARERNVREGFTVTLPKGPEGVYTISAPLGDPLREATLHLDQYSGRTLADVRWRDYGVVPKLTEMGIAVHEGLYFGLANQLLMLLAALSVILLSVSGVVMWLRRRPSRTLGAPSMPPNFPLWKGAVAIIVVMGVLFPMVGASLLLILTLDRILFSRLPRLKKVLG